MFRNEEFRSIVIKLIIIQLIFAVVIFALVNVFIDNINKKIILRDMSMVGSIIREYPELKEEIIPYISKEISEKDRDIGESLLREYGYNRDLGKNQQVILKNISPNIQLILSSLVFLFIIPLGIIISGEYKKIYKKVRKISYVAEEVVEGNFSVSLDEEGEGDFYMLNHQINQMANRLENTLDKLNKEKIFLKDTISDISHQLKTPLSSLIMLNDILQEDEEIDHETRRQFLEKTSQQLDRMEWLIINLLKLARIEAGAIDFKKDKLLLKDSLSIALKTLEFKLENQDIKIKGDMNAYFYGDIDWTSEAIINILKNAAEHNRGQIEVSLEDTPLFSTIRIKDNGSGIDKTHLPHIFRRFYKASSESKSDSIGIGLNLAKIIVEAQNGTIRVKSSREKGTEFIITFLKI